MWISIKVFIELYVTLFRRHYGVKWLERGLFIKAKAVALTVLFVNSVAAVACAYFLIEWRKILALIPLILLLCAFFVQFGIGLYLYRKRISKRIPINIR